MKRLIVILFGLTASTAVLAFPFDNSWHMPAAGDVPNGQYYDASAVSGNNRAGAGGIYGTGGAQDYGIKCSSCHIEGTTTWGQIDADISVTPSWGIVNGDNAYVPGSTYNFTVSLLNEHRLNDGNVQLNGFALAIEDASGKTAGVYITDSGERSDNCNPNDPTLDGATETTFVYGDCHAVLSIQEMYRTVWNFQWTAPAAGSGDLTLFYSVVDGDQAGDNSKGDDVKEGTIPLKEGS